MKKAIRIRIYPDGEQTAYINRLLGCCRFLYNKCLEFRKESYETEGKGVSAGKTLNHITLLKDEFPFLREVHSKVLQQSVRDLNTASSIYCVFSFLNYLLKKRYPDIPVL